MPITRDNHYVPQMYLKNFASENGELYRYRLLVPNDNVRFWKRMTTGAVAYRPNLYTRTLPHGQSDEIEKWLSAEFETPAEKSLYKAVHDERLTKDDYRLLVRFAAAQCVRTPAFMLENLPRWRAEAQKTLDDLGKRVKERLQRGELVNEEEEFSPSNNQYFPLRVSREPSEDGKSVIIKTETVVGRGTWIFAMRHLLTKTIRRFSTQKWTILSTEDDLPWFTTDDPLVRLNFRNPNDYNFQGGWGVDKTNIFMPLSPKHLLFTQIGDRPQRRGTILPRNEALLLRKIIAEHAHRYIFSSNEDPAIPMLRPRHVSLDEVRREDAEWRKWHDEQSAAERELISHH